MLYEFLGKELIPSRDPHLGASLQKFSVGCLKLNGLLDPLNLRLYELNTSCGNNYVEQSQGTCSKRTHSKRVK
ncbi:hypothetical protein M0804_010615 [Polistes exclamans]|nr:hypothetical protein M0804_010615 [Polistes exclamans]